MRPDFDPSLYLVTDRSLCRGRSLPDVVAEAVAGGVRLVQLREKQCGFDECVALARQVKTLLAALQVPLLINDRVDVALAVGASGVHLGQGDMPCARARELLGPDAIIGLTAHSEAEVAAAEDQDVDYLGVGPIFPTTTKTVDAEPWGLDGLARLRRTTGRRLVAIGGVNAANAAAVIQAGADGLAVVSAICAADSPRAAAEQLCRRIADGRRRPRNEA